MADYDLDSSDISALFKRKYEKPSEQTFNTMYPILGQIKQKDDFTGAQKNFPVPLSFGGSVGSGSLPTANTAQWGNVTLTRKKVYGRLGIDRETIYAAKDDAGSFVRATKEFVRKTVESYTRNTNRILFGKSDGSLGTIASGGVSGSNPYVLTISDATWKEANFEENDYVNIETGNTDLFEITLVDPANKQITVNRISGSQVPAQTDEIFMQGSEDNDPAGLEAVCDATSGSLFGVTVQRRFQAYQKAAGGAGISIDLLNEACLEMIKRNGKKPSHIAVSYVQYRKLLNQMQDQKVYNFGPKHDAYKAILSFTGIEHMTPAGAVPIVPERFVPDSRVYLLNTDFIEMHRAPGFGWFSDDGTVLLRQADSDAYEARYGGYFEFFINPAFQGTITGLAV